MQGHGTTTKDDDAVVMGMRGALSSCGKHDASLLLTTHPPLGFADTYNVCGGCVASASLDKRARGDEAIRFFFCARMRRAALLRANKACLSRCVGRPGGDDGT